MTTSGPTSGPTSGSTSESTSVAIAASSVVVAPSLLFSAILATVAFLYALSTVLLRLPKP